MGHKRCVGGPVASPFVGRSVELQGLASAVEAAGRGRGGLWLVGGEAGIGKSRLVQELAARHDVTTAWGRAWEAGATPPFWPWTQILRGLVRSFGTGPIERLGPSAGWLRQVLPELDALVDAPVLPAGDAAFARVQLLDTLTRLLEECARTEPLLVVFEDTHAADDATLSALEYLAEVVPRSGIVVVGTFRPNDLADQPSWTRLHQRAQTLALRPLDLAEVQELLDSMDGSAPAEVAASLHEAVSGNPLLTVETIRWMRASGRLQTYEPGAPLPIADAVRATLTARLDQASETTRSVLQRVAVLGRSFTLAQVSAVFGPASGLVATLAEAIDLGLVETLPGGEGYRFCHALFRDTLILETPTQERWRAHAQAAAGLARLQAIEASVTSAEIAHHWLEAGPQAAIQGGEACLQASRDARHRLAFADAERWSQRGLQNAAADEIRFELFLELGRARLLQGEFESGRAACREALTLARALDDAEGFAAASAELGSLFVPGAVDAGLIGLLEEALDRIDASPSGLRAELMARLAAARQPAPDPLGPIQLAREAIAMARARGDEGSLMRTLRSAASALMDLADPHERRTINLEHGALARQRGQPVDEWRAHLRLAIDGIELADIPSADEAIDQAEALAERLRHTRYRVPAWLLRSMRSSMEGRFDEALKTWEECRRAIERSSAPELEIPLWMLRASIARLQKDDTVLSALLDRLDGFLAQSGLGTAYAIATRAGDLIRMDRRREAKALVAGQDLFAAGRFRDTSMIANLGLIAQLLDDAALARQVRAAFEPATGRLVHGGLYGSCCDALVDDTLANVCAFLGDHAAAERYDRRAARLAARFGIEALRNGTPKVPRSQASLEVPALAGASASRELPTLVREGELWRLESGLTSLRIKDSKGIQLLARLFETPGEEWHVLDLVGAPASDPDAGPVLDARAKAEVRGRLHELSRQIDEAEAWNDHGRLERLRTEMDELTTALTGAFGLGGRARKLGSSTERARVNAQRRIRDALGRIEKLEPALGRYLNRSVRTGTFCAFDPL